MVRPGRCADVSPVLVIGATGRVGRELVSQLQRVHRPVRALTRQPKISGLPEDVEVMVGDLTAPESLMRAIDGVKVVFLVWTAPFISSQKVIALLAERVERVVLLSSPHQTAHPFFQQSNPLAPLYAELEQLLLGSGLETTIIRPGMFAANAIGWWAPQIRAGDIVRWPCGGGRECTDR